MKATEQFSPVALFIMLYNAVLSFESSSVTIQMKAAEEYFLEVFTRRFEPWSLLNEQSVLEVLSSYPDGSFFTLRMSYASSRVKFDGFFSTSFFHASKMSLRSLT